MREALLLGFGYLVSWSLKWKSEGKLTLPGHSRLASAPPRGLRGRVMELPLSGIDVKRPNQRWKIFAGYKDFLANIQRDLIV